MAKKEFTVAPEAQGTEPEGLRILVVDDNVDAADCLAMVVQLAGHEAQATYDGPTALAMAQIIRPHVVLLDIGLPGMDGYEVARQLRANPVTKEAILTAMTGWGQDEDRQKSKEAGIDHHLVKPVEPAFVEKLLAEFKASGIVARQRLQTPVS